jgi:membrane associated rhomboid family serine protease
MDRPIPLCNYAIMLLTGVVSYLGFRSRAVEEKYIFRPEAILAWKEYHRLVSSAFLHADWRHLLLNMVSLYLFGRTVELYLGHADFLMIYFGAIVGGGLLSLYIHRHHDYLAYGASGGVCGIIFAHILLFPGSSVGMLWPVPVSLPGWLYAILFMVGSFFAMKAGRDNVGHDAHLGGAIIGFLIAAGLCPEAVRYNFTVFLLVLGIAVGLMVYLYHNPLLLAEVSWLGRFSRTRSRKTKVAKHKRETLEVDAILDKVAKSGVESLSGEEKLLLKDVSGKYQRRADSKKPESGLAI